MRDMPRDPGNEGPFDANDDLIWRLEDIMKAHADGWRITETVEGGPLDLYHLRRLPGFGSVPSTKDLLAEMMRLRHERPLYNKAVGILIRQKFLFPDHQFNFERGE